MKVLATATVALVLMAGSPLGFQQEDEARALEALLIAPCCFTQQVSVHQSPAADEVRRDVRARLAAGQTRQQILDAYEARYGRKVLADPPARGFDVTLYVMPLAIFLGSIALLTVVVRRFAGRQLAPAGPSVAAADPQANARLDDELRDLD